MTEEPTAAERYAEDGAALLSILDELTDLISTAKSMPMSASALVNRAGALDLLSAAKDVVPRAIQTADAVVADADALKERSRAEAEERLAAARREAEQLASQEAVVAQAEERADQIIAGAEADAVKLMADADDYCDRKLAQFEIDLGVITSQVRAGREALAARAQRDHHEAGHSEGGDSSSRASRRSDDLPIR